MTQTVRLTVNNVTQSVRAEPGWRLLTVLRDELGLTGAKYGCGEGECGACTVLVAGEAVRSCVATLADVLGKDITTIEGLAQDGQLHPAQQAFAAASAYQCGFCTPGFILRTAALLNETADPADADIVDALRHNICRCGTYPRILQAVQQAAAIARGDRPPADTIPASTPAGDLPTRIGQGMPWAAVPPSERDYVAALGEGLVIVTPPAPLAADRPAPTGIWGANGGAWLHVGTSGAVTGFTGKVEVGQDNRSALTALLAEELGANPGNITLVMGDTDRSPHDPGTFGSRSMPDAGYTLRLVAAAARERLIQLAARRWSVAEEALIAREGQVVNRQDGRAVPFADLVRGLQLVESAAPDTRLAPPAAWRLAGRSLPRVTTAAVVTGSKVFPSDIVRPGMLHGAVLRPPAFGATLRSADLTEARAVPGAVVVQDGGFIGAAAADPFTARRAVRAVKAEWTLPPSTSENQLADVLRSGALTDPVFLMQAGDLAQGAGQSVAGHRNTYEAPYIAHAPLETRVAVAAWHDGRVTVWTGSQRPFGVAPELAAALGIPEEDVQVIIPDTGGAFGGKHTGDAAIEAARLARAAHRPVRVMWSREEEFAWAYFRPAALIDIDATVANDGTITSWRHTTYNAGAAGIVPPYHLTNVDIAAYATTPPLRQGSYRALGATANTFARERHIDALAEMLRLDPVQIRLKNLRDDRLRAVLLAASTHAGWESWSRQPGRGRGIALGTEKGGQIATYAEIAIDDHKRLSVTRLVTAFECGAIVQPDNLVNQIEGALVMGLGGALREAIHYENGRILNPRFSQYRVPRIDDVPPIEVVLLNRPDLPPAGGAETPIITVAPAIANAIADATGLAPRRLPLAPEGRVP